MSEKPGTVITPLCVIALALSAAALVIARKSAESAPGGVQYFMYLGTNDKDTEQSAFPPEEAKAQAEKILIDHLGGYKMNENQTVTDFYSGIS
ncbi:MAG: hypothetical protein IJG63_01400 [Oscillospiraceae bacterium]|nr:hypothetical protein [Oscillospiraceae bacterium]